MRHRLEGLPLPASVLALFVGVHMLCDPDTGRFFRDDAALRNILDMPKSTVHAAFSQLVQTPLVTELAHGEYIITDYETDRIESRSYFRLTPAFISSLSAMVSHHQPNVLLFALELLDCQRNFDAEIRRKMKTLVHDRQLGSCPSRVYSSLKLLNGMTRWSVTPNAMGTDVVLQFWPLKDDMRSLEQDQFRALHGEVTRSTIEGYRAARGTDVLTWRELSRTTRKLIEYGVELNLHFPVIARLGSLFGAICAQYKVTRRMPYLRRLLRTGDLLKLIPQWRLQTPA
ncbi:hypothetical protein LLE49_27185 [Alicyclobacillus tolerans]|uniref:hypothetical protein n=1 Tax=Alicyclobacillus tolerans TaxID=90970 RepID=UPI001F3EF4FD|nr:hypothetical protein [Alicyclobacillus tolerans]MCF8568406.1 hypothetical protein [Alicyclobacillus tolerans]